MSPSSNDTGYGGPHEQSVSSTFLLPLTTHVCGVCKEYDVYEFFLQIKLFLTKLHLLQRSYQPIHLVKHWQGKRKEKERTTRLLVRMCIKRRSFNGNKLVEGGPSTRKPLF